MFYSSRESQLNRIYCAKTHYKSPRPSFRLSVSVSSLNALPLERLGMRLHAWYHAVSCQAS